MWHRPRPTLRELVRLGRDQKLLRMAGERRRDMLRSRSPEHPPSAASDAAATDMCGIVGAALAPDSKGPDRYLLEQAVSALRHRGPDDSSIHMSPGICLGHTRLSIIDLEHGSQPMTNEDGSVLTIYNGEIWNFEALRRELTSAGHRFRTRSDTEVLVHGYEEWGDTLPSRLHGMFAFAVWDARNEHLLLARDRIGKKPLFFTRTRDGLTFGSDARSVLIVSGTDPELDRDMAAEYLFQRYVCAPRTLFKGVEKLPPGHLLTFDRGHVQISRYWSLPAEEPQPMAVSELRALLRKGVQERLMSDVPLGILLSGGLDSTALLGLMREAGAQSVASFTIGFADKLYDERPLARVAAEAHGSEHHELEVSAVDFADALPRLAWFRDDPIAEPSEVPLYLLAEFAQRHVKVVFSGEGGDELFGGYPKYRAEALLRSRLLPAFVFQQAVRFASRRRSHRRLERAAETIGVRDPRLRWASWFRSFSPPELRLLLAPALSRSVTDGALTEPLRAVLAPYGALDPGRQMLVGDLLTYLPDNMLARADKVLMAASIEGRMPLLDQQLLERVCNVPASGRSGILAGKSILRRAVADLIPRELRQQPKRGFPVPLTRLLFQGSGQSAELLLSERCLDRGLFDRRELEHLVQGNGMPTGNRDLKLFTLLSLELWCRANVDALRLTPPQSLEDLTGAAVSSEASRVPA
jgi:asparagine synthase (glutamine-hydrolysing)